MVRFVALYGAGLAALALLLEWLDYKHAMRTHANEFYVIVVALIFGGLGIWVGHRLTAAPRGPVFIRNDKALAALGISAREVEVLQLVATGHSNKTIARALSISPNTVKSHVASVFMKLGVNNRIDAIRKAQSLDILP